MQIPEIEVPPGMIPSLEKHYIPHDIKIYPDSGHSLFNDRYCGFCPDAASDAWQRMPAFFNTHLGA